MKNTFSFYLSSAFGILWMIMALTLISQSLLAAFFVFLFSLALLPSTYTLLENKFSKVYSKKQKTFFLLTTFVLSILFFPKTDTPIPEDPISGTSTTAFSEETKNISQEGNEEKNNEHITEQSEQIESIIPSEIPNPLDNTISISLPEKIENEAQEILSLTDTTPSGQNTDEPEAKHDLYTVIKVVDGDTIDVQNESRTYRLRLIGIDTPEVVDPRKDAECYGREASTKAKEILMGKKVRLENDPSQGETDRYGRLLRYVFREDGLFYNKWIIENGYAHEYTYNTAYKYQKEFREAEVYARENKKGLWHPDACAKAESVASQIPIQQNTPSEPPANDTNQNLQNGEGHTFYTSSYRTTKFYYCDTDSEWKDLSPTYLENYPSEEALKAKYPNKTLHEPCK